MTRVSSIATILISSGTPERRQHYFNEFLDEPGLIERIDNFRVETSKLAQLINILRTEMKGKPINDSMKSDEGIKSFTRAFMKMARIEKLRKLEENIANYRKSTNPKDKLMCLMLKAQQLKMKEEDEKTMQLELEAAVKEKKETDAENKEEVGEEETKN